MVEKTTSLVVFSAHDISKLTATAQAILAHALIADAPFSAVSCGPVGPLDTVRTSIRMLVAPGRGRSPYLERHAWGTYRLLPGVQFTSQALERLRQYQPTIDLSTAVPDPEEV